ncbi:MAG: hypothetical protein WKG07_50080 [Hymenobacter sp.]
MLIDGKFGVRFSRLLTTTPPSTACTRTRWKTARAPSAPIS